MEDKRIKELYRALERLGLAGEVVNAYGGAEGDAQNSDGSVLMEFIEYIDEHYPGEKPAWMEAFCQVFMWQYNSIYEGVAVYYTNFYGFSDSHRIAVAADFLRNSGYGAIAQQFTAGIADCGQQAAGLSEKEETAAQVNAYKRYLEEKGEIAKQIDAWINWNTELVWEFYFDILEEHKREMLK